MSEMLNTLAISVEKYISREELNEMNRLAQESKDRTMWIIILAVILVAEIALALLLPKYMKKYNERKEAEARLKAERKRIQSQRKKEY